MTKDPLGNNPSGEGKPHLLSHPVLCSGQRPGKGDPPKLGIKPHLGNPNPEPKSQEWYRKRRNCYNVRWLGYRAKGGKKKTERNNIRRENPHKNIDMHLLGKPDNKATKPPTLLRHTSSTTSVLDRP